MYLLQLEMLVALKTIWYFVIRLDTRFPVLVFSYSIENS
jgi:hypothetical protein